jgi:toxin-antitoxin system PIN domain toxin
LVKAEEHAPSAAVPALFDVNVLIALLDAAHQYHRAAWTWLEANIDAGWATCPITENGYVRIVSQPGYPNPSSTFEAMQRLRAATENEHHAFWPDSLSLLDCSRVDPSRVHGPQQLTDIYLLALAVANKGRLVSFDHRISTASVVGAEAAHLVLL